MSLTSLWVMLVCLFAVCAGVIWRNMQQQKRPRRRFKIGRSRRRSAHPIRRERVSYTELARRRRDEKGHSNSSFSPGHRPPNGTGGTAS